ncbi:TonB-dependent siderophore receptor [Azospirillum oleiclasticum]|nr:TonB-dependent siderophore receptor [Azospirillum oleiclasticum]
MGFGKRRGGRAGRALAALWLGTAVTGMTMGAVQAQGTGAQGTGAAETAPRRIAFDIPAAPLGDALASLGRQARLQIAYAPDTVAGLGSPGFRGTATAEEALRALLSGSGIAWRFSGPDAVTLSRPVNGALMLDPVTVVGQGRGAGGSGAVPGTVATDSATATKTDTPITEIPQSVSVVTRKEMEQRGVTTLNGAIAYTPGVRAIDYPGGPGAPDILLRGFRDTGLFSVYRDGLRAGFNAYDAEFEPYSLERIDVLKGPASVLFGQGSPGGIINLTSKRPSETPIRELQFQAGSHDRIQGAADFSGAIDAEKRVLVRLTGLWRDSGTQIDHAPDDRVYVAPAITLRPNDRTSLTLLASHLHSKVSGSEQSIPMVGSLYDNPKGQIGTNIYFGEPGLTDWTVDSTSIGYAFEHKFTPDWSVQQNTRYTRTRVDFHAAFPMSWPVDLVDGQYYPIGVQDRPKSTTSFLVDTNVQGRVETGPLVHRLLAGLDYARYSGKETRRNSLNTAVIDILNPVYGTTDFVYGDAWVKSRSTIDQLGVYLQDQVKHGGWVLTLGGRQDWVINKEKDYLGGTEQKADNQAFTGRVGLAHVFENGLAPYASYATSFQPESGSYAPERGGGMFSPTTGTQYEVGVKYQPPGRESLITVSLFHLTQQNVTTNDPVYSGFSVQDGEVRSRGLEIEGKLELTEEMSLIASYAYIDAEITKDNAAVGSTTSREGLTPSSVPRHTASLWADYTVANGVLRGLGLGAGVRYVGSSYNAANTVKVPDYTLVDAAIRYELGELRSELAGTTLALTVTNLTDKEYVTPGFYDNTVFYGNRRQILGTVTYRW